MDRLERVSDKTGREKVALSRAPTEPERCRERNNASSTTSVGSLVGLDVVHADLNRNEESRV